jgi:hypothetical protein
MNFKDVSFLLVLENVLGIHRNFCLASNIRKILICGRIMTDLTIYTIFIAYKIFMVDKSRRIWIAVISISHLIHYATISLFAIQYSGDFKKLKTKLCRLLDHYKGPKNQFTITDVVRIMLFMILSPLLCLSIVMTVALESSHRTVWSVAVDILNTTYSFIYLAKHVVEYHMYVSLVSKICRLIESLNMCVNAELNKIVSARGTSQSYKMVEDDVESWSTHYRMMVECSKLVNICFGKQVKQNLKIPKLKLEFCMKKFNGY